MYYINRISYVAVLLTISLFLTSCDPQVYGSVGMSSGWGGYGGGGYGSISIGGRIR